MQFRACALLCTVPACHVSSAGLNCGDVAEVLVSIDPGGPGQPWPPSVDSCGAQAHADALEALLGAAVAGGAGAAALVGTLARLATRDRGPCSVSCSNGFRSFPSRVLPAGLPMLIDSFPLFLLGQSTVLPPCHLGLIHFPSPLSSWANPLACLLVCTASMDRGGGAE